MTHTFTRDDFIRATHVSRETAARLEIVAALLTKWQGTLNLVSSASLADLWRRHMLDSAQLFPLIDDPAAPLADLGSGGGFPGLVLAIMGAADVHLIDGDARKCAFLREAARASGTPVTVHNARIETLAGLDAATVTARACAPMPRLLALAARVVAPDGVCLFLKGADIDEQLTGATKYRNIRVERFPSATSTQGTILRIKELCLDT